MFLKLAGVRSFGMIQIRINDPRSLGSLFIKGTEESLRRVDSSVPSMHHDPSDLGSLILTPKGNAHVLLAVLELV